VNESQSDAPRKVRPLLSLMIHPMINLRTSASMGNILNPQGGEIRPQLEE
jgi:hypothetical protein